MNVNSYNEFKPQNINLDDIFIVSSSVWGAWFLDVLSHKDQVCMPGSGRLTNGDLACQRTMNENIPIKMEFRASSSYTRLSPNANAKGAAIYWIIHVCNDRYIFSQLWTIAAIFPFSFIFQRKFIKLLINDDNFRSRLKLFLFDQKIPTTRLTIYALIIYLWNFKHTKSLRVDKPEMGNAGKL